MWISSSLSNRALISYGHIIGRSILYSCSDWTKNLLAKLAPSWAKNKETVAPIDHYYNQGNQPHVSAVPVCCRCWQCQWSCWPTPGSSRCPLPLGLAIPPLVELLPGLWRKWSQCLWFSHCLNLYILWQWCWMYLKWCSMCVNKIRYLRLWGWFLRSIILNENFTVDLYLYL